MLNAWNIQLNLGNFTASQSSSWLVRTWGVPRIEYLGFYHYVHSVFPLSSSPSNTWKIMEKRWGCGKKIRLKNCKAIKKFIYHFYGVSSQVSPTDSDCTLMKIVLLRGLTLKPYTSSFKSMEFCICCMWRLYYMTDAKVKLGTESKKSILNKQKTAPSFMISSHCYSPVLTFLPSMPNCCFPVLLQQNTFCNSR